MQLIPISSINIKVVSCCGERLTNISERATITCPKCKSVYGQNGKPLVKVTHKNGEMKLVL